MSRYWKGEGGYSQPTTEKLQKNAAASQKRAREKGQVWEPVVIQGRTIASSWWGRRGAGIWSATRTTTAVWTVESGTCGPALWST